MQQIRRINDCITIGLLDLNRFASINGIASKRQQERAGTAYLLGKMLGKQNIELLYTGQRKPYLDGSREHISISHSHDKLAIIINTAESTGIDIELVREKVKHVEHKFLNEEERKMANGDIACMIRFWAAKEALYKTYGLGGIDFRKNLFIETHSGDEIMARLETAGVKKKYKLACEQVEKYQLVYVVNEI